MPEQVRMSAAQAIRLYVGLFWRAVAAWYDDSAASMGAALAFYTAFSLAPILIVAIAIAGAVFGDDAARGAVAYQLQGLVGSDGAVAVQSLLAGVHHSTSTPMATVIGLLVLCFGASSVFAELQVSLDRIWRAPVDQRQGVSALLRARLLAFGMVIAIGFLLLVSLVVSAMLSAANRWGESLFPGWGDVLQAVNVLIAFGAAALLFACAFRILPRVFIAWSDVWIGALVTSALFTAGKYAIGLYLGRVGVSSGFGAAGSLIAVLLWVYYSAQVFFLGAEFTWVYATTLGSRSAAGLQRSMG